MAFHDDGMKAQSSATLRRTRGFSASAPEVGFARTEDCSHTVSFSSTNCVGTTTGSFTFGPARGDQVPERMRLNEGAPLVLADGGVDRRNEHGPSLARAGRAQAHVQAPLGHAQTETAPISSIDSARWRL